MAVNNSGKPTITDVGREAGVSQTTVSYVLSGSHYADRIKPETRRKVLEAAKRLGYSRNPLGTALKRGYSDTINILVVTWELASDYARNFLAISQAATESGLSVNVNVAADDDQAVMLLRNMLSMSPYGLIITWDSADMADDVLTELHDEGLLIVDLLPPRAKGIVSVTVDREQGWHDATAYLISLGHRRIGFILDNEVRTRTSSDKFAGYRRALREAGIELQENMVQEVTGNNLEAGRDGFLKLIERCPDCTAVIGMNDHIALGAVFAAIDNGIKVPDDLSIMGGGGLPEGAFFHPTLSTVQNTDRYSSHARDVVDVLMKMRNNPGWQPETMYKPMELVIRESTGLVKTSSH